MESIKKTKLAVFDIDGTIFRSSLVIELINGLVANRIFPKSAQKETEAEYLAWLDRKGTYEAYINKVVQIYAKYIRGKSFSRVNAVARKIIAFHKNRTYRYTRYLIKKLKKEKYLLVAISGSPSYIVEGYARAIGFNEFFGTELEINGGIFTGKIENLDSAFNKAKLVKEIKKQYPKINFKESIAVGDTEGDIEMLKLVGKPIAFNPNFELAKHAKRNEWPVIVERKDVIYKVRDFNFLNIKYPI